MTPLQEIGYLIVQTLGSMYLLIVLLRFMLQIARADFYNPISQFIVKASNPLLLPMRKAIPGFMGIDVASLILALFVNMIIIQLTASIMGVGLINPLLLMSWGAIGNLYLITDICFWSLIIMVVVSWIAPQSNHPMVSLVYQLIDPMLKPFRRILPDMGGLDITPIFAFLTLNVLQILIRYLASMAGINGSIASLIAGI